MPTRATNIAADSAGALRKSCAQGVRVWLFSLNRGIALLHLRENKRFSFKLFDYLGSWSTQGRLETHPPSAADPRPGLRKHGILFDEIQNLMRTLNKNHEANFEETPLE